MEKDDRMEGERGREIESERDFGRSTVRTMNTKDNSEPSNQSFIKNNIICPSLTFRFIETTERKL